MAKQKKHELKLSAEMKWNENKQHCSKEFYFHCKGPPECREEEVTLIGEKPVEECQVLPFLELRLHSIRFFPFDLIWFNLILFSYKGPMGTEDMFQIQFHKYRLEKNVPIMNMLNMSERKHKIFLIPFHFKLEPRRVCKKVTSCLFHNVYFSFWKFLLKYLSIVVKNGFVFGHQSLRYI